jgi:hypothetical protein
LTALTQDSGVHLEGLGNPKDDVFEVNINPEEGVLTAFFAGARPALRATLAEEGLKNIAERPKATKACLPARVVAGALLRVREHLIGVGDGFEALLSALLAVHIRMKLTG